MSEQEFLNQLDEIKKMAVELANHLANHFTVVFNDLIEQKKQTFLKQRKNEDNTNNHRL